MTKFYLFATSLLTLTLFTYSSKAQIYTAVRDGKWVADAPAQTVWDLSGQPPADCNNCTITINPGVTITLNTSQMLSGNTILTVVGTGSATQTQLLIPASTSGTGFANSNNLILAGDGINVGSTIRLTDATASITVDNAAGTYDGILSSSSSVYRKILGNQPEILGADGSVLMVGNTAGLSKSGAATLSSNGTLPIILSSFTASLEGESALLHWTTSLEFNSDHISIQRSTDAGATWQTLGTVPARGTSALPVDYTYTDLTPAAGTNQYRLLLVDRDGKYAYSGVKTIRTELVTSFSLYPNPARDFVNVTLGKEANGTTTIRLISPAGQLLLEKKVNNAAGSTISLPVSSYPQGNYLVLVAGANGALQTGKLFITK